jgi:hypothetical protein
VPQLLCGVFEGTEPLYLDLRWAKEQVHFSRKHPSFAAGLAQLSATIRGRELDEIFGDDVREQRRTRNFLWAGIMVLLLAAIFAGWRWWGELQARQNAEEQRSRADGATVAAQNSEVKVRKTAALADLDLSSLYLSRIKPDWPEALAHLARGLRTDPANALLRQSSILLLTTNVWYFPSTKPIPDNNWVPATNFSPDGTRIVTASYNNNTARIWDARSGEPIGQPFRHDDSVNSASFSPDGTRIVTASLDHTVRIWDARSGEHIGQPLRHDDPVNFASFSPDGTQILTGSFDARIWDVPSGKPIGQLFRHEDSVNFAGFSPDGAQIVTASGNTARLWDAQSGKPIGQPFHHDYPVTSANFSPDGVRIVTASDGGSVRIWNSRSGKPIGETFHHDYWVSSASFSSDATRLVTASSNDAHILDARSGEPIGGPSRSRRCTATVTCFEGRRLLVPLRSLVFYARTGTDD